MSDVPTEDANGCSVGSTRQLPALEPEAAEDGLLELLLGREWEVPVQERVVDLLCGRLGDERDEPFLQLGEDLPHLGRLHAALEVVEESVVGLVHVEERRVLAAELDVPLEMRQEEREVRGAASLHPDRVRLGGRARLLLAQLDRNAELLLPVGARGTDQARLVRVVVERLFVRTQILEQPAEVVRDQPLVDELRDRPELVGANAPALRRHHRLLVPGGEARQLDEIPELAQLLAELPVFRLAHGSDLKRSCGCVVTEVV